MDNHLGISASCCIDTFAAGFREAGVAADDVRVKQFDFIANGTKFAVEREATRKSTIEVMADERWKRLAEQQGIAYAKTVAEAMNLKLDADNPADREKLRRAVLDLVAGRKMPKQKGRG
jgi:hypothetical protein